MERLDFRRGLILAVVALRDEELFAKIVDVADLRQLPIEVRQQIVSELGQVDAAYGFGPVEKDSPPNYLACCIEAAIDYVNPASD